MYEKLMKLIEVWTQVGETHLRTGGVTTKVVEVEVPESNAVVAEAPKAKRGRKKKEAAPPTANPNDLLGLGGGAPVAPPMTAEESAVKVFEVARTYAQRFVGQTPDGATRIIAHMTKKYNEAKLANLNHEQRIELMAWLNEGIEG